MINFDDKFKKWIIKNLEIVRKSTNEEWLIKKVRNFVEKHGISNMREILEQIKTNDIVAAFFAKDPSKQGIHEKTASEYLLNIFPDLKILPKSGKNSKYVVKGEVSYSRPNKSYKSIDFQFTYKGFEIFASHKYTNESGGAQDNQRNDLISFVEHADLPKNKNHIFIAIADGDYYSHRNNQNLNTIQEASKHIRVFATNSNDLKRKLVKVIENLS